MLILAFSKTVVQRSNINSAVNIACKFKSYITKSKLVLSECNDLYFIATACIAFTLHEIKQCPVFFGTPGIFQRYAYIRRILQSQTVAIRYAEIRAACCDKLQSRHKTISSCKTPLKK
jgi:hypothetical protein